MFVYRYTGRFNNCSEYKWDLQLKFPLTEEQKIQEINDAYAKLNIFQ